MLKPMSKKIISLILVLSMLAGVVIFQGGIANAEGDENSETSTEVSDETLSEEVFEEGSVEEIYSEEETETIVSSKAPANVVVVLDPGHGGSDGGASGTWDGVVYRESEINQAIANACKEELEKNGNITVYLTRKTVGEGLHGGIGDDLDWRCAYAHEVGADLYVSLHCNAVATGLKSGAEVYIPNTSYCKTAHDVAKTVGTSIGVRLTELGLSNGTTYIRNSQNGSTYDDGSIADYYAVIRGSKEYGIPGMIVEHCYLTSQSDCQTFLSTADKIKALGVADAKGIIDNLKLLQDNRVDVEFKKAGWAKSGKSWVYFNEDGTTKKGFFVVDGFSYYALDSGEVATGWKKIDNDWYYFNDKGAMYTSSWQQTSSGWVYLKGDGKMAVGPNEINGYWYLFDSNGYMRTGWAKYDNIWYYMNASGAMYRNAWYCGGGYWYYLTENGTLATGVKSVGGVNYCFDENGRMASGWMNTGGDWYYALDSGALVEEAWSKIGGKWYYFGKNGKMATGWVTTGGTSYYMNSQGALQTGWITDGTRWYFALDSGAALKKTWYKSGSDWYYFDENCRMATGLINDGGTLYITNNSGQLQCDDWVKNGNDWYYALSDGALIKSNWYQSGNTWYYFGEDGKMVTTSVVIGDTKYIFNKDGSYASSEKYVPENKEEKKDEKEGDEGKQENITEDAEEEEEPFDISQVANPHLIMGTSEKTAAQMVARYNTQGFTYPSEALTAGGAADIETFVNILVEEANAEGVKAEVVFAQVMNETAWLQFGGDVQIEQFNFCGLGATGGGEPGYSFTDVREGLRAEVQHLKGYASKDALKNECVDPRFKYVERGVSEYVEYLGQKENPNGKGWATQKKYGLLLAAIIDSIQ